MKGFVENMRRHRSKALQKFLSEVSIITPQQKYTEPFSVPITLMLHVTHRYENHVIECILGMSPSLNKGEHNFNGQQNQGSPGLTAMVKHDDHAMTWYDHVMVIMKYSMIMPW